MLDHDINPELQNLNFDWKKQPIADQLKMKLEGKAQEIPGTTLYSVRSNSPEYKYISELLADMLDSLPFHNEVGSSKIMRSDAMSVIEEIKNYLRGRKSWIEISNIFQGKGEVFKNEVYTYHNLPSAFCYNVDLSRDFFDPNRNGIKIERFHITNNGKLRGYYDGEFQISSSDIVISTENSELFNLHTA